MVEVQTNKFKFSVEINDRVLSLEGKGPIVAGDIANFCVTAMRGMYFDDNAIRESFEDIFKGGQTTTQVDIDPEKDCYGFGE